MALNVSLGDLEWFEMANVLGINGVQCWMVYMKRVNGKGKALYEIDWK